MIQAALLSFLLVAGQATAPAAPQSFPAMQRKLAELVARVAELERQNKALAAENAALKAQASKSVATTRPARVPESVEELHRAYVDHVKTGMTLDEVKSILGPTRGERRVNDSMIYDFTRTTQPTLDGKSITLTIRCIFSGGKLVSSTEFSS